MTAARAKTPRRSKDAAGLALRLRGVRFRYGADHEVLCGIDLDVRPGTAVAVMGASGCGKTTLLKTLNGLLRPSAGEIDVLGRPVASWGPSALLRRIGYIPQQLGLVRSLSAEDNVVIGGLHRIPVGRSLLGMIPDHERDRSWELLERVGLAGKEQVVVHRLSGGERQRVAIARALMQGPQLLLADEFVSDLDAVRAIEIMDLIEDIKGSGLTVVMALHDLPIARSYADHLVVLRAGAVAYSTPAPGADELKVRQLLAS